MDSLGWLVKLQQSEHGWIMPIGSHGFYRRGEAISYFDQQPVEVYSLISACLDAYRVTKDLSWYNSANQAFEWFFGRNALGIPVYDSKTGGCRDGLLIDRLNENQGAESTLYFIQSLLEMQQFGVETLTQRRNHKSQIVSSQQTPLFSSHQICPDLFLVGFEEQPRMICKGCFWVTTAGHGLYKDRWAWRSSASSP